MKPEPWKPSHFDARWGLSVDCRPGPAASTVEQRCGHGRCGYIAVGSSLAAVEAALFDHETGVHLLFAPREAQTQRDQI
jgi:hypothetical protein